MKFLVLAILLVSSMASANECIMQSRIRSFNSNDPLSVTINAGRQDYFMTVSYCRDLPWAHRIGFRSFSGSRVCSSDKLLILDNFSNRIIDECFIRSIEKI